MKSNPALIVVFILLTVISTSCKMQNTDELTEDQKKLVSNEIETIMRNFLDAKTLSFETHTGLRADKEGYVMGGEGNIKFTDYSSYKESMKAGFAGIQRFTECEIVSLYIYVLSKDAATCTTEFKSKFLTTTGDTLINNGCWTFVFKKFDKDWKVIQENGTHLK